MSMPRFVVSGLSGGVGKTTVSLGLTRAFTRLGLTVHPFKKGPDYIDTAWLALAAKGNASTLDPFFCPGESMARHFFSRSTGADIAVIEGNRGLFDGKDIEGSASTAEVAKAIDAPILLLVDITKMTRTTAALVAGCKNFPGGERIAGVILNRAGTTRHASIARRAVEELAQVPVFGVLPRLDSPFITEHRAGLVTVAMHEEADEILERTADFICDNANVEGILELARGACLHCTSFERVCLETPLAKARIGVVMDGALWEYYDENLEALRLAGAELVFVSLLADASWPDLDGLYLGGGDLAPHAAILAKNTARKKEIRSFVEVGMPVYAEHAGYFYLCESYSCGEDIHAMTGVFPVSAASVTKPVRLGYMEASVSGCNPFLPIGLALKGHEYHYTALDVSSAAKVVLDKKAGSAVVDVPDGLVYKSAFGTSMQIFAPAVPQWAAGFVRAASAWRKG